MMGGGKKRETEENVTWMFIPLRPRRSTVLPLHIDPPIAPQTDTAPKPARRTRGGQGSETGPLLPRLAPGGGDISAMAACTGAGAA